jgi:AraC-like DNA-binding protein
MDGLALELLGSFLRYRENPPPSKEEGRIHWATEHMRRNFSQSLAVPQLAEACGCSEGHFYRAFRREIGVSPMAFLQDLRTAEALKLLRFSDLKIEEISRRVGYNDPLYFSRAFKKTTGQSPSQFRQALQRQE